MLDLELLTSDSDLELEATEGLKPRKKYEESHLIFCCCIDSHSKGVGGLGWKHTNRTDQLGTL